MRSPDGSVKGGDAGPSRPSLNSSLVNNVEMNSLAQWPASLVQHEGHDLESDSHFSKSDHMYGFVSITKLENLSTEHYMIIRSSILPKTLNRLNNIKDWSDILKELVDDIFQECVGV